MKKEMQSIIVMGQKWETEQYDSETETERWQLLVNQGMFLLRYSNDIALISRV
jgi:hypothetical protein